MAFLAAARGIALPLEDDFLVFLEDFDGPEGQYTLPEVDELSSGYLSGMGVPNSGILLPNDGFVRFSLTTDLAGGDQSQSISLVGGSIDRTSASARARYKRLIVAPGEAALTVTVSTASILPDLPESEIYVAFTSLEIDWTAGGPWFRWKWGHPS